MDTGIFAPSVQVSWRDPQRPSVATGPSLSSLQRPSLEAAIFALEHETHGFVPPGHTWALAILVSLM